MAVGTVTRVAVDPKGITAPISLGDIKMTVTTVVGASSYTTGGDSLTYSQLGLKNAVTFALVFISASSGSNCSADSAQYDATNQKLMCFSSADSAGNPLSETSSTTNLSGLTFTVVAFGY